MEQPRRECGAGEGQHPAQRTADDDNNVNVLSALLFGGDLLDDCGQELTVQCGDVGACLTDCGPSAIYP